MDPEFAELIRNWRQADYNAKEAKQLEAGYRQQIAEKLLKQKAPGTHRFSLDKDWDLKAQVKESVKVEQDVGKINNVCNALVATGLAPELVKRLFKWECDISTSEYKRLNADQQKIVDAILTVKQGMPSLEIAEAKG